MRRMIQALRRLRRSERASSAVEFALVAPVIVSMLFGAFEFGRALWTQALLNYAVEEASRCASVNTTTCATSSDTQTVAANATAPLNLPTSTFTVTSTSCGNKVTASYAFNFIAPNLFPYSLTLTSQSCYPI